MNTRNLQLKTFLAASLFLSGVGSGIGAEPTAREFLASLPALPTDAVKADCKVTVPYGEHLRAYSNAAKDREVDRKIKESGDKSQKKAKNKKDNELAAQVMSNPQAFMQMMQQGMQQEQQQKNAENTCEDAKIHQKDKLISDIMEMHRRRLEDRAGAAAKRGRDYTAARHAEYVAGSRAAANNFLTDAATVYDNHRKDILACLKEMESQTKSAGQSLAADEDEKHSFQTEQWDYAEGALALYDMICSDARGFLPGKE